MTSRQPDPSGLPTSRQLARAAFGAAAIAGVVLITAVLPAEYGIDPTGVGAALGLTPMGEIKRQDAAMAEADAATAPRAAPNPVAPTAQVASGLRAETVRLILAPGAGTEVKATMRAGDEIDCSWTTDWTEIRFELHGEETGAVDGAYTSYQKGTSRGTSGTFRAPFDGTHGWYWRNRSAASVAIEVRAIGIYSDFSQLK